MNESNSEKSSETVAQTDAETKVESKGKTKSTAKEQKSMNTNTNSVALSNANFDLNSVNLFDEKSLASVEVFLTKVMKSSKGGITSVNDGLAVLMRAKDLGLPFSTCLEHIHVINGKTGVDIHIVKALLSRAGCTWVLTKDYQPLYEYTDGINIYIDGSFPDYAIRCVNVKEAEEKSKADDSGDYVYIYPVKFYKDFNGNIYRDYQLNTKHFSVVTNQAQATDVIKDKKTPVYRVPNQPVDYITEYEITRNLNGKVVTAKGRFSFTEATKAGMFEKDTYIKYCRILIGHRAFTYASREVASDILFGVSETTELKIVAGAEISSKDVQSAEDVEYVEI